MLVAEHGTGAHSRAHRARLVVVRRDVASSIRKSRCWLDDLGVGLPRTDRGRRLSAGHCRPFSRSLMMKTISGSIVGWISFACGTGAPIGNTMSSVSQATIGESVPVRCCLARLVSPSLSQIRRSPRASHLARSRSWIWCPGTTSRSGYVSVNGSRSRSSPSRAADSAVTVCTMDEPGWATVSDHLTNFINLTKNVSRTERPCSRARHSGTQAAGT